MIKVTTKGLPYQAVKFSSVASRMRDIVANRYGYHDTPEQKAAAIEATVAKLAYMAQANAAYYIRQVN